ncbi:MAG: leucine--tRNA ligase, partial [Pseudomonadota bacterium]
SRMGEEGFASLAAWPEFDPSMVVDNVVTMGVQVNGKMRGKLEIGVDEDEAKAVDMAKEISAVQNALEGKNIVKVIYKAGKILNLIAK